MPFQPSFEGAKELAARLPDEHVAGVLACIYSRADSFIAGPLATLLNRLAKAEGEYEAGLQHRNDMYDRIVSLRIDVGAATARAEATAAERDALQAQVARLGEALKRISETQESYYVPRDELVSDLAWRPSAAALIARAALKTQEAEHGH